MKKLIIYTCGGISNRIFPIVSGIEFAKMTNRELYVYWPVDRACPAKFHDLYKTPLNIVEEDFLNDLNDKSTEYHSKYMDSIENDFVFFQRSYLMDKFKRNLLSIGSTIRDTNSENILFVSNNFLEIIPKQINEKKLKELKIADDCNTIVENFIKQEGINSNTIGIHIRGTDFKSYSNNVIDKIRSLFTDNEQRFYICSDDENIEKNIINIFHNVIYRKNKKFINNNFDTDSNISRGDVFTMKDSIIDLYLLGKTNLKMYNNNSYYSLYAKILSDNN